MIINSINLSIHSHITVKYPTNQETDLITDLKPDSIMAAQYYKSNGVMYI